MTRTKEYSTPVNPEYDHRSATELANALSSLRAHTAEIVERKKQLNQLNRWFNVALNNMGRGLSMFDSQQRLIVCNKLYREIYDLPQRLTRPGTALAGIVRYHVKQETGLEDADEIERQLLWIEGHVAKLARGATFSYVQQLKNGRIVQVTNQPLPGGGWVDIQEDITERRRAEQRITWLAHHDPLTEVANRVYFSKELDNALRQLEEGTGFALHWIDLDNFKVVNDTLGHPLGDALLKSVAKCLRKAVRDCDLVARLGGDEFAIIQTGITKKSDAEDLCARLLSALRAPHRLLGHEITVGASIGLVLAPEHGATAEELMKNVDVALYGAKSAGRGSYRMFEPSLEHAPSPGDAVQKPLARMRSP
ncbi:diguanylate cyclase domain-containing protein [Methylocystis sp.]|uniref:diguanylate cyclase domain-containing protein n=1 Tax=Methylocystis sp. TaxID=1911079 RepID=UPI003DA28539